MCHVRVSIPYSECNHIYHKHVLIKITERTYKQNWPKKCAYSWFLGINNEGQHLRSYRMPHETVSYIVILMFTIIL